MVRGGMEKKICTKCKEPKLLSDFRKHRWSSGPKGKGVEAWCKLCKAISRRKSGSTEPPKPRRPKTGLPKKEWQRDWYLRRTYGITSDEYETMLKRQNGVCRICRRPPEKKFLAVDHHHESKKVRALLCTSCNVMIGHAQESPVILRAVADYLESFLEVQP